MGKHNCTVYRERALSGPNTHMEDWRITCTNPNCDYVEKARSHADALAQADRHEEMPHAKL